MAQRVAEADWYGSLKDGNGKVKAGSGSFEGSYTWSSRFEDGKGTNPEELLGAAHAGCFSMAFSSNISKAGFSSKHIHTRALVTIEQVDGKNRITKIHLETEASVEGIKEDQFQEIAESVKQSCPVSVALSNVPTTISAKLV